METNPPNPFKGLRPYCEDDSDRLFGRDRDLVLMKDRIFSARTTLLFAGSGVGKTSFLNAKVIPELRKQCTVIWYNRWTGADEIDSESAESTDEGRIRFWLPRALWRGLLEKRRLVRHEDSSDIAEKSSVPGPTEDGLALEVRATIAQSLRRSDTPSPRLSEVLSSFIKPPESADATRKTAFNRCILILDQFEEVFQYHAFEDYFRGFIEDLCQIINRDDYQVRVVFSMREEFLGELSIFDNRISDLFNNYYRLKYPDKNDAKEIIRRTCEWVGVSPDEKKIIYAVEDLSKIEKGGGSFAERSTGGAKKKAHVIKRNFVAPPYLQIACAGLWNEQYPESQPKDIPVSDKGTTPASPPSYPPFLIQYHPGGDNDDDLPGGDAQRILRDFCEEKLSKPYLSSKEQDLAARAFGFLVTKQGAKMAYELSSLADHMDERIPALKQTLEKLSADEAKILRKSRGPDRSYWFELYHDMYATIVDDWKIRYLKVKKRRERLKVAAGLLVGFPATIIFLFAMFHWVINPLSYEKELMTFKNNIGGAALEMQPSYLNAVTAYSSLRGTAGYHNKADSLWADILERRAQWYESANNPAAALLSLLKAAAMASEPEDRRRRLNDAEILLGPDISSLLATYCDDCASASLGPDGKTVLTLNLDGQVRLWDAESGRPMGPPFCSDCVRTPSGRQAMFTSDGRAVMTVAQVASSESTEAPSQSQAGAAAAAANVSRARYQSGTEPVRNQPKLTVQFWETASQTALGKPIDLIDESGQNILNQSRKTGAPSETSRPDSSDDSEKINISTAARVGGNFWLAGVKGKQIYVWDGTGRGRVLESFTASFASLSFSRDGRYLKALRINQPPAIWQMTGDTVVPYPINQLSVSSHSVFSPNGRRLLTAGSRDNTVQVVDLDSRSTVASLPRLPGTVRGIGFSPSGEQFFTTSNADSNTPGPAARDWRLVTQIWETASGAPLYQPLKFKIGLRIALGPDGKTLVTAGTMAANGRLVGIEKWDPETGGLLGVLKIAPVGLSFSQDRTSAFTFTDRTARWWRIDSNTSNSQFIHQADMEPQQLSLNGQTLLTINKLSELQFWDLERGVPLGEPVGAKATLALARISGDGKYAAADSSDSTIRIWQPGAAKAIASLHYADEAEAMAFSADDRMLAAVYGAKINLWGLATGSEVTLGEQHTDTVNDIMLSADQMISGSDDKTARIWNLSSGQRTKLLPHRVAVTAVALSPDGRLAITGCADGTVSLWDVASGEQLGGEIKVDQHINELAFSSDGRTFGALTPNWAYLGTTEDRKLHYLRAILISDPWEPLLSFHADGKELRFVYQLGPDHLQIEDVQLEESRKFRVFAGDPDELLAAWQEKLGLRVGALGKIERMWPAESTQPGNSKQPKTQTR